MRGQLINNVVRDLFLILDSGAKLRNNIRRSGRYSLLPISRKSRKIILPWYSPHNSGGFMILICKGSRRWIRLGWGAVCCVGDAVVGVVEGLFCCWHCRGLVSLVLRLILLGDLYVSAQGW